MRVELFDFDLPEASIAQEAIEPRDAARLMHVHAGGISDLGVRDVPALLNEGDLLVFNDSRVIPARLYATLGERQVEVLLHQCESGNIWRGFARPAKKLKPEMRLCFGDGFEATVLGRTEDGQVRIAFDDEGMTFYEKLEAYGHMPLPPYIAREDREEDQERYQTIYARERGSVAAPTAGLHFTDALFNALDERGIGRAFVTLHVGAGTFLPVKVEDVTTHKMHAEWGEVTEQAAAEIAATKAAGGRVIPVGTTALRLIESASRSGQIEPWVGETDIFIYPGFTFHAADALMTNFHLPKSTLMMLVSALVGQERIKAIYQHAVDRKYRFFSYGDASLLIP